MNSAIQQYRQTDRGEVDFANPHRIIQMLMQRFLEHVAHARGAMERKEIERKNEHIKKAIMISAGLRDSLDFEQGGDIARQLEALYSYFNVCLTEANLHDSVEMLDEVRDLMLEIKTAWDQVPDKLKQSGQQPEP